MTPLLSSPLLLALVLLLGGFSVTTATNATSCKAGEIQSADVCKACPSGFVCPPAQDDSSGCAFPAGCSQAGFLSKDQTITGNAYGVKSLAMGDLDGDSRPDLAYGASDNQISMHVNLGNGHFGHQARVKATDTQPYSVSIADFNSDGHNDLAAAFLDSSTIGVFLNSGDGSFGPLITVGAEAGSQPFLLALADFNGDGHTDVASCGFDSKCSVYTNLGNGTSWGPRQIVTSKAKSRFEGLVVADFNGDRAPDLAALDARNKKLSVFLNIRGDGDAEASSWSEHGVGSGLVGGNPTSIAVADFNGDGISDLACAESNDQKVDGTSMGTISVFMNFRGDGILWQTAQIVTNAVNYPISLAAADYDGDGISDLACASWKGNSIEAYRNLGDGMSWSPPQILSNDAVFANAVMFGDFDGDGAPDLFSASSSDRAKLFYSRNQATQPCPAGTFSAATGLSNTTDCAQCPAGTSSTLVGVSQIQGCGPTSAPTTSPSQAPSAPTTSPSQAPTESPTTSPTVAPTTSPTAAPTTPTVAPTTSPSQAPTAPTTSPTKAPTTWSPDDGDGMGAGMIALAVVGSLLGVAALVGAGFVGGTKMARRRRQLEDMGKPIDPSEDSGLANVVNPGLVNFQTKL